MKHYWHTMPENSQCPQPHSAQVALRQQIEIEFWRDDPLERPGVDSLENQLDKSADALIFYEALKRLRLPLENITHALELGGGQGWASCILKRLAPYAHVTTTDISEFAVASVGRWERVFDVKIDAVAACKSYEIPVASSSLDFVFCFAAAHHFIRHRATLKEIARVLKPGGIAAYLYEPTSPRLFYKIAKARVNAKRPHVPEDLLLVNVLRSLVAESGLTMRVDYWPTVLKRRGNAALYYTALSLVPFVAPLVPCTANITFAKPPLCDA
jgi:SAM-dependent methyltransferase